MTKYISDEELNKILKQLPKRLTKDWVSIAIDKIYHLPLSPEQKRIFNMTLVRNASILEMREYETQEAVKEAVKEAVEEAVKEVVEEKEKVIKEKEETIREQEKRIQEREAEIRENTIATAKKLKALGIEPSIIQETTGLSTEEIEQL